MQSLLRSLQARNCQNLTELILLLPAVQKLEELDLVGEQCMLGKKPAYLMASSLMVF